MPYYIQERDATIGAVWQRMTLEHVVEGPAGAKMPAGEFSEFDSALDALEWRDWLTSRIPEHMRNTPRGYRVVDDDGNEIDYGYRTVAP